MSNQQNQSGIMVVLVGFFLLSALIGSCTPTTTTSTYTSSPPKNDYEDMRSRGHSEEDAVIFSILKQQGLSDYEALRATKASKE